MAQADQAVLQLERNLTGVQIDSVDPKEFCKLYRANKSYIDIAIGLLDKLGMKGVAAALRLLEKIADSMCPA